MPAVDNKIFEDLKQMSGADFIGELIDTFLEDGPNLIDQLKTASRSNDVESFRRAAHSLKSNAATFGAQELAALAKELEDLARANNLQVGNKLEALEEKYAAAARELEGLRP
jgi:HPt (histidine-containing phosphotransfer) domain-containing protein